MFQYQAYCIVTIISYIDVNIVILLYRGVPNEFYLLLKHELSWFFDKKDDSHDPTPCPLLALGSSDGLTPCKPAPLL